MPIPFIEPAVAPYTVTVEHDGHPTLTCQQLIDRMVAAMALIPPEPIGEWMRTQGHPPEEWVVVFPESVRPLFDNAPAFWPTYVRWSKYITEPAFYAL